MPIGLYFEYLESSILIKNYERGEKLEFQTTNDQKAELIEQAEYFKRKGLL